MRATYSARAASPEKNLSFEIYPRCCSPFWGEGTSTGRMELEFVEVELLPISFATFSSQPTAGILSSREKYGDNNLGSTIMDVIIIIIIIILILNRLVYFSFYFVLLNKRELDGITFEGEQEGNKNLKKFQLKARWCAFDISV